MQLRPWLAVLAALFLSACLDADFTLQADGSVSGKLSWTSESKLPEQGARALLAAENVTIKHLELSDVDIPAAKGGAPAHGQHVTAELEAKSAAALTAMPLFKSIGVTVTAATPEESKRSLTVRAAKNDHLQKTPDTESVVHLHLPGAVLKTSASAKDNEVTWKIPAADFKSKSSVELSVTYAAPPPPDADKSKP